MGSFVAFTATFAPDARAQQSAPATLTLDQAVAAALANHPRIQGARANEAVAAARVDEAESNKLPDVGVSAQLNRSTGNTPPGAFFSTTGFPPISGAPRGKAFDGGTWQTGVSLYASYDILSIARQAAAVDVAIAGRSESEAATNARRLDIAYQTADSFLATLEAQEAVKAAGMNAGRAKVLAGVVKSLVDQSLRPGADGARADAELALAQTAVIRAEQQRDIRRSQLAEAMGNAAVRAELVPGAILGPADEATPRGVAASPSHPQLIETRATVDRAGQVTRSVELEYLPRVDLVAALWLRGSGLFGSPAAGLVPDIPNWAVGAVASWSFFDIPTIRARARGAVANEAVAAARRDETSLAISGQLSTAAAMLDGAVRIARNTPIALSSARAAEEQATARFRTGLTSVVEVADAQRLLAQAELDDAVARLEVRRAQLLLARAAGDLTPFFVRSRGGAT